MTERFTKALPLLALLLILSGITRAYFYYRFFNIPLNEFLKLGESFVLFTEDLFLVFSLIIGINLVFGFKAFLDKKGKKMDVNLLRKGRIIIILLFLPLLLIDLKYSYMHFLLFIAILWLFFANLIHLAFDYFFQEIDGKSVLGVEMILVLSFIYLVTAGCLGSASAYARKNWKYKETIIFLEKSDTIKTDSKLLYLGKTEDWVYLYDKGRERSRILPISSVKEISY